MDGENDPKTTQKTEPAPENGGDGGQRSAISMTNEQLNERLSRARSAAISDFLKELGIEKPEDAKAVVNEHKQLKDSQLTAQEKAEAALQKEKERADAAEARANQLAAQRRTDRIDGALRDGLIAASAHNPRDVIALLRTDYADRVEKLVAVDGNGDVDEAVLKKLIEDVSKAKPYMFKAKGGPGSPSNADGKTPDPNSKNLERASATNRRLIRG
jgi:alanyl-tRNA synthetase